MYYKAIVGILAALIGVLLLQDCDFDKYVHPFYYFWLSLLVLAVTEFFGIPFLSACCEDDRKDKIEGIMLIVGLWIFCEALVIFLCTFGQNWMCVLTVLAIIIFAIGFYKLFFEEHNPPA